MAKPLVGRLVRAVWTRVLKDVRGEQERKAAEAAAQEARTSGDSNGRHFWKEVSARFASDLATAIGGWAMAVPRGSQVHTLAVKEENSLAPGNGDKRSLEREFIRSAFADTE